MLDPRTKLSGTYYDWTSMVVTIGGVPVCDLKSISYKQSLKHGLVRGTGARALGRTRGQYECSAEIELYLDTANKFISALSMMGKGYMEQEFEIVVSFAELETGVTTDTLVRCTITDEDVSPSQGEEAVSVKYSVQPLAIMRNGALDALSMRI